MKIFQSILCIMLLGISVASWGQEKKAYRLFDANGKEVGYREIMKVLKNQDVVFLGEVHNCAIAHWMEYEIVKDLCEVHKGKLAIGLEMLEADNQLVLDEYVGRLISSDRFEALDKLSAEAKGYIAPLPIDYVPDEEAAGMFGMMMIGSGKKSNPENVAKAQALKDATMGWFIAQNLKSKFVHLNGNYHSDFKKGIITYLKKYRPNLKIATVCSVRQDEIDKLGEENEGRADFYICVPTDMTMTY